MNSGPVFARHETFHPRYSWLKKGFDEAEMDPEIFIASDAHVRLGVGKNMVRAIRYWCHAFGVLKYDEDAPGRSKPSVPTFFGKTLLGEAGHDPYLEDLGSLWRLHWQLLRGSEATAWRYTFFEHARPDVSVEELVSGFQSHLRTEFPGTSVAVSSLKKDAHCILRMYGELPRRKVSEESIQCPWAELRILTPSERSRTYNFRFGEKPGLSDYIVVAACLEYAGSRSTTRTAALPTLLHGRESPGLAFKLTESAMYHAIENVVDQQSELSLSDTAGVVHLALPSDPSPIVDELIADHYDRALGVEAVA